MAQRDVTVRLSADVNDYIQNVRQASRATSSLSTATDRAAKSAQGTVGSNRQASTAMAGLGAAAGAAGQDTEELDEKTQGMAKRDALGQLAPSMTAFGAATTAGLGAATKAAIDWESAWAGVQKTVEGTPEQMAELEEGLRSMARELPASHAEIAAVAEAAGQLGVATPDVEDFTRTMIDMGESTNMSADEAATTLARFANVMGTSHSEMENLGSAIVGLGNTSATTESEIAAMGQRLAAAGTQAGMSEGEVLGIAAAMSSVGIEAEAGGTAMSKTMKRIGNSVDEGGDKLEGFAELAGMSASEFQAAWEEDSAAALQAVVEGLGRAEEEGQNVNGILSELGITAVRESDALLRLSSASELMGDSMQRGNEEFEKASALSEEAQKRYDTAASRISAAWGSIQDAAIEAGAIIAPVVADIADLVGTAADTFADLPGPAKAATTALGGLLGLGALGAGSILLVAPQVKATAEALGAVGVTGPRARRGLKGVGKAAGVAAVAFGALQTAAELAGTGIDDLQNSDEMSSRLKTVEGDVDSAAESMNRLTTASGSSQTSVNGLADAMDILGQNDFVKALDWVGSMGGIFDREADLAAEAMEQVDTSLSSLADSESFDALSAGMQAFKQEAESAGLDAQEMAAEHLPDMMQSLRDTASDFGYAATDAEIFEWALTGIPPAAIDAGDATKGAADAAGEMGDEAKGSQDSVAGLGERVKELAEEAGETASNVQDMADALNQAGLLSMDSRQQVAAYQQAIDDLDEHMQDTTATLDLNTQAGRDNQDALFELARSGLDAATGMVQLGEDSDAVSGHLQGLYDQVYEAARGMGASKKEAGDLAREILSIPQNREIDVETAMDNKAKTMAEQTKNATDDIPEVKDIEILTSYDSTISTEAQDDLAALQDKTVSVDVTDDGTVVQVQEDINGVAGKDEFILVGDDGSAQKVQARINDVTGKTEYVYVDENGTTTVVQGQIDGITGKSEYVLVRDNGTSQQVQMQINGVTGKTEYVYVDDNGTSHTIQARINGVTGKTEYVYVDDDGTTTVVQGEINSVQGNTVTIGANASVYDAEQDLNHAARNRFATIFATVSRKNAFDPLGAVTQGLGGQATGGRAGVGLRGYSGGGRLPSTGLGTDQILGLNSGGRPTAWVDDKEWIINRRSSDKYDKALRMINADHPAVRGLASFASGGRPREHSQPAMSPGVDAAAITAALASVQGESGPRFNITNNYPQAEPTSKTVQRGLDLIGGGMD